MDKETLYINILPLGRGESLTSAEIGGWRKTPNYPLSYLLAARMLLEQVTGSLAVVALPAAYLQRHAFELGLKRLLELSYGIQNNKRQVKRTHSLISIYEDLKESLNVLGLLIPEEFKQLAEDLTSIESGKPDSLRYKKTIERRCGTKRGERPSFPKCISLEINTTQEKLEKTFLKHIHIRSEFCSLPIEEWTLLETLNTEVEASFITQIDKPD